MKVKKKTLSYMFAGVLSTVKFDKDRAVLAIKEADDRIKDGYKLSMKMKLRYELIKRMINTASLSTRSDH